MDRVFELLADKNGRRMMREWLSERHGIYPVSLGRSILGEEIDAYFIGKGGVRVVYFGSPSATESATCNLLFAFMDALLNKELKLSGPLHILLKYATFVIVPMLNPDGVELRLNGPVKGPLMTRQERMADSFDTWRANARGVDIGHNFSFGFYEHKKAEVARCTVAGPSFFGGEFPESEPESSIVAGLIKCLSPSLTVLLSQECEGIACCPRNSLSARIAERAGRLSGYRVVSEDRPPSGGLAEYSGAFGIPSLTVAVGRGRNPACEYLVPEIAPRLFPTLALLPTML